MSLFSKPKAAPKPDPSFVIQGGRGDEIGMIMDDFISSVQGGLPEFRSPDYQGALDDYADIGKRYEELMSGGPIDQKQVLERAQTYTDPAVVESMQRQNQETLEGTLMNQTASQLGSGTADSSKAGIAQGLAVAESNRNLNDQMLQYQDKNIDRATSDLVRQQQSQIAGAQGLEGYLQGRLQLQDEQANFEYLQELQRTQPELYELLTITQGLGGMANWK